MKEVGGDKYNNVGIIKKCGGIYKTTRRYINRFCQNWNV